MGSTLCQEQCERRVMIGVLGISTPSSGKDISRPIEVVQLAVSTPSGHDPGHLAAITDESEKERAMMSDEDIARGVELATSEFLNNGERSPWRNLGTPRSADPDRPSAAASVYLEKIIRAQQDMCVKLKQQDAQIRRIVHEASVKDRPLSRENSRSGPSCASRSASDVSAADAGAGSLRDASSVNDGRAGSAEGVGLGGVVKAGSKSWPTGLRSSSSGRDKTTIQPSPRPESDDPREPCV
mmetsp:Transcript_158733/g.280398  ORF Transcript_158733/g.280398 Transcript_158733/m.280398 type:complete len:240 (+) Transcript_158733:105-824(+)